jgi:hypothetical protein
MNEQTDPAVAENTGPKQRGRPFVPGQSGNPHGKPKGAKHTALLALDAIGAEGAEAVLRKTVEAAQAGDIRAAEVLLSRVWPARKSRPVEIALPALKTAADLAGAMSTVIAAAAAGTVTLDEAQALAGLLELHRKAIEVADLDARVRALEGRKESR